MGEVLAEFFIYWGTLVVLFGTFAIIWDMEGEQE